MVPQIPWLIIIFMKENKHNMGSPFIPTIYTSGYLRRKGLVQSGGVAGKDILQSLQRNFGGVVATGG